MASRVSMESSPSALTSAAGPLLGEELVGTYPVGGLEHGGRADVVVGGEAQTVGPGYLGALAAAAAQDPDLQRRALAGDHVGLLPFGGAVGAGDQGQHVADLLGVVLRLRVRQLQQPALQREPG